MHIPMPNNPLITAVLSANLSTKADGTAEIILTQTNMIGCEARNGTWRMIKDYEGKGNANIQGSMSGAVVANIALKLVKQKLMDASVELGAKANVNTTIHLYDEDGNKESITSGLPIEYVDQMAPLHQDVVACSDLNAHWLANIKMNSSSSLLGRLGLSANLALLNENNASLFPEGKRHLENGHVVEACTRKNRIKLEDAKDMKVASKIRVDQYVKIVYLNKNKQIEILSLPEGYSFNDLIFSSLDESVATVDQNGLIYGLKEGGTEILIETKDKKHMVHVSVLVPTKARK